MFTCSNLATQRKHVKYYRELLSPSLWDVIAAYIDSCITTFRENLYVTISRFKQSKMFMCSNLATQTKHVKYYRELLSPSLWDLMAAYIDSCIPTFREDLSVTPSRFKRSKMFTCSNLATQRKHLKHCDSLC